MLDSIGAAMAKAAKAANPQNAAGESAYYDDIAGGIQRAEITLLDTNTTLVVQFNPQALTVTRGSANWGGTGSAGPNKAPERSYTGHEDDTLSVDLLFDASEEDGTESEGGGSIMTLMRSFHALTLPYKFPDAGEHGRPPVVRFAWGSDGVSFAGVVKDLSFDVTMFNAVGHPMRATVKLTLTGEFLPTASTAADILAGKNKVGAPSDASSAISDGAQSLEDLVGGGPSSSTAPVTVGQTKVPGIKVYVDGQPVKAPLVQYLTSVECSEALNEIDILEARFTIPSGTSDRDKLLKLAKHGAKMKVEMLEGTSPKRTLEGVLAEVGYLASGARGLQMVLRGLSDLTKVKYSGMAIVHEGDHAKVVKEIAGAAGLGANIQGVDGTGEFYFQPNVGNAEVVKTIAKQNNYVFRVDEGKLVFTRSDKAGEGTTVKVPWKAVTDFTVTQSLDGIVTDVTVTGKDLKANKWLKGQAKAADISKISGGTSGPDLAKKAFGKVEYLIDHTDDADQSQLVAMAKGELQRRAERFVQGEFTSRFIAGARSGAKVEIEDPIHSAMKGPFIVREVTQMWDPSEGYRSRIRFFSDSLPKE